MGSVPHFVSYQALEDENLWYCSKLLHPLDVETRAPEI